MSRATGRRTHGHSARATPMDQPDEYAQPPQIAPELRGRLDRMRGLVGVSQRYRPRLLRLTVADLTPPQFVGKPTTVVCDGCRACDSPAAWLYSVDYLLVRPRRRADDFAIVDPLDNLTPEGRIRSVGYDLASSVLEVEFVGGHVYEYYDVPLSVYSALMESDSKGSYFNDRIRDMYTYQETGDAE